MTEIIKEEFGTMHNQQLVKQNSTTVLLFILNLDTFRHRHSQGEYGDGTFLLRTSKQSLYYYSEFFGSQECLKGYKDNLNYFF